MQRHDAGGVLCDMHSHVLPGMDDGCKTPEESRRVVELCVQQGVSHMAATPHFYADRESAESFLARRDAAAERLMEALDGRPAPQFCLGAEVAYYPGLLQQEGIERLCLGRSNYLLLEMPFSRWTPSVLRTVRALRHEQGVVPILAHIERFSAMADRSMVDELVESGVLIQMNAEFFLDAHTHRQAVKLLRHGMVDVLGSDCHGAEHRPPNLGLMWERMGARRLAEAAERIAETSADIFELALEG